MGGRLKLNAITYIAIVAILLSFVFSDLLGIKLRCR